MKGLSALHRLLWPGLMAAMTIGCAAPLAARTLTPPTIVTPVIFDPSSPRRLKFGALEWRGGIEISSEAKRFGGFSGLVLDKSGTRLIAVADTGWWLTARLHYDAKGWLSGFDHARMAPLLNRYGRRLKGKWRSDSESVIRLGGSGKQLRLAVSFERKHRILVYQFGANGFAARGRKVRSSRVLHNLRSNKGIEALGRFAAGSPQKGALIAISERTLDEAGNNRAWLLRQDRTASLSVRRRDDYDITDAAVLPGGDLLILERKFRLLSGPAFRIRRIAATGIRAGAVLDGDVLIEADYSTTIDNMEGLALHRAANGELRLTLISDDNYSILQHTLLLQFALPGE